MSSKERLSRMVRVRALMLKDQPFFGLLATKLTLKEDPHCKTLWTDSQTLGFNPEFVDSLLDLQLKGYIAKGVLHIAAGHPWRQRARTAKLWNQACSHAVAALLEQANMYIDPLFVPRADFEGLAAEAIYAILKKEQSDNEDDSNQSDPAGAPSSGEEPGTADEQGGRDPSSTSSPSNGEEPVMEVRPGNPSTEANDRREWAMAMATATRMQGNLPGGVRELVNGVLPPAVDWRDELRTFFERSLGNPDYTWSRPSKRMQHLGMYLPTLHSEGVKALVFVRDTSGSIDTEYARRMNSEIADLVSSIKPEVLYVLDVDAALHKVQTLEHGCDESDLDYELTGRGGTSFVPPFKWIADEGIDCAAVIYASDLFGKFPEQEPDYPVLWLRPEGLRQVTPPFGEVIEVVL